jgi:DNA topoisomerase I
MTHVSHPHLKRVERPEPVDSARAAHLRYVSDQSAGIKRRRAGDGFIYFDSRNKRVTNRNTLARIQSLAIPPAWENVWICSIDNGHLQAIGYDARHRKQYRYHPRWREVRDGNKFDRICAFGKLLPKIRRTTRRHLALPNLPREKVLAALVRVMMETFIRVGNEEYAKSNHSYGLTTLKDSHAKISTSSVHLHFRGKSGRDHEFDLHDKRLVKIIRSSRDLPGQDLFQYKDEHGVHDIKSDDVNDYLREITSADITAKDFRTWAGTLLAAEALCAVKDLPASHAAAKRQIVAAINEVARQLGNTAAVCKKCYIHPAILEAFEKRSLHEHFANGSHESALLSLLKSPPNATSPAQPALRARR